MKRQTTEILKYLRDKYSGRIKGSCCENKCNLNTGDPKDSVIFKGEDLVGNSRKICDCIIFLEDRKIILVEIKTRSVHPGSTEDQLSNGADVALDIVNEYGCKFEVFFLILFQDGINATKRRMMRKMCKPKVFGIRRDLTVGSCKCNLKNLLIKHGSGAKASGL